MLDVRLNLLPTARGPLKQRTRIRLHHGTAELLGRVYFMDRDLLTPGEAAIAQVRLEGLVAASRGDRCVVRSYSPMVTIGGATVIDPTAARHRRSETHIVTKLETLEGGDLGDLALQWITELPRPIFTVEDLAKALQLDRPEAEGAVAALAEEAQVARLAGTPHFAPTEAHRELRESVVKALRRYHAAKPLAAAMPKDALQADVGRPPAPLLDDVLSTLAEAGELAATSVDIRLAGHDVCLSGEQQRALDAVLSLAERSGFSPPAREAALEATRRPAGEARGLLDLAMARGDLVPVGEQVYHASALIEVERRIEEFVGEKGPFTIADLRDLTGSSRKYMVPLAEHLDGIGFTRRHGDLRTPTRPARKVGE